jgi:hypothetical protein
MGWRDMVGIVHIVRLNSELFYMWNRFPFVLFDNCFVTGFKN